MKIFAQIALAALLGLMSVNQAQARIFTPFSHWWSSGRTCIESRAPAGLRWDDLPPRACVALNDRQGALSHATEKAGFAVFGADDAALRRASEAHHEDIAQRPPPVRERPSWRGSRVIPICLRTRLGDGAGSLWQIGYRNDGMS